MNEQEKKLYEQGNPFLDYNHIKVVSASPDRAEMAVELVPESRNLYGFMHGGLIYTLLECTAGLAARQDGRRYVTQSSHINFLTNCRQGTVGCPAHKARAAAGGVPRAGAGRGRQADGRRHRGYVLHGGRRA